uniref:Uncharacterized protein n=1 Tax=Anopheles epiroticus TaxID=199890 RepID=A0A182PPN2_9DIPT
MEENGKSVAHPFASQKVDKLILEETEAGRRFLATLRRNHERELEASDGPGTRELTAAVNGGSASRHEGGTFVASRSLAKDKRSSLRATLEHLIVRYLRRLTSDDDADGDDGGDEPGGYEAAARYRRQSLPADSGGGVAMAVPDGSPSSSPAFEFSNSMEITLLTNDTDTNQTDVWDDGGWLEEGGGGNRAANQQPLGSSPLTAETGEIENSASAEGYGSASGPSVAGLVQGVREVLGQGSVGEPRGDSDDRAGDGANGDSEFRGNGDEVEYNPPHIGGGVESADEQIGELRQQRKKEKTKSATKRGECTSVRKRVSQLDRFELERSMRNGSFREYNIRNALNYRMLPVMLDAKSINSDPLV